MADQAQKCLRATDSLPHEAPSWQEEVSRRIPGSSKEAETVDPEPSQERVASILKKFETRIKTGMLNVLIVGRSGAGKSTLINEIFEGDLATTGSSEPVTMETRKYTKRDVPLTVYDTRGLELMECNQILNELLDFVERNQNQKSPESIHLAWLCIVEDGRRVEEAEKELARRLNQFMPVIAVITKARADKGFSSEVQRLLPEVKNVVRVRAIEEHLDTGHVLPQDGLENLVEVTAEMLPEGEALRAFVRTQKYIKLKKKEAHKAMWWAVASAVGAGGIPIPLVSQVLLVPIQVGMLVYIGKVFGINAASAEFWKDNVTGLAVSLGGVNLVVGGFGSVLKFIPGVGTVTGAAILSSSSAMLTYKIGAWYIDFLVRQKKDRSTLSSSLEAIKQGFKEFSDKIQKRNFKVVKTKI
ncbi:MAG TPA: GTP-binding protein [Synechococcus sp. UBA8638]|nr:GTP-binding protein [Synechococcus sp. UBA8638]